MGVILDDRVQRTQTEKPRRLAVLLAVLVAAPMGIGLIFSAVSGATATTIPPPHVTPAR